MNRLRDGGPGVDVTKLMVEKENAPETMQKTVRILHFTAYKKVRHIMVGNGGRSSSVKARPGLSERIQLLRQKHIRSQGDLNPL